ncbi:MAG TPA: hypothetical protein VNW46_12285 [Gemmatimonadaceae bacterium]|jgi:hypothetical protein|nr:hypothetical protein [Gemmatimonadaceae bacterium]
MERGLDFLKAQVNHVAAQHQTFLDMLAEHRQDARDGRFRALCARFLAPMHQHQEMLEHYQQSLGTETGAGTRAIARAAGFVRDLADRARDNDYHKLLADMAVSRQCEDTFWTFRQAGMQLGDARLERLGDIGWGGHDEYGTEARQLATILLIEYTRGMPLVGAAMAQLADTDTMPTVSRADAGPMGPVGPGASYGSLDEQNRDAARDT